MVETISAQGYRGGLQVENVSFDYFKGLDLRIAEIKNCEEVPGADRLYKLTIDLGEERQIVAGIKAYYTKDQLVGKKIVVVANLEPRTLRGIVSHGMLLAASSDDKSSVVLLTPDKDISNGAAVS
jgi:methionyl-tRNA synthetase